MRNESLQEIMVALALGFLLLFFIDPFMLFMPDVVIMIIMGGLIVAFGIFAMFVWKEHPADERESLHSMIADRVAFLAGGGALVAGIIIQTLRHNEAPWLVLVLGIMIAAKIAGLMWARMKL